MLYVMLFCVVVFTLSLFKNNDLQLCNEHANIVDWLAA
jgi:hypothetical protein